MKNRRSKIFVRRILLCSLLSLIGTWSINFDGADKSAAAKLGSPTNNRVSETLGANAFDFPDSPSNGYAGFSVSDSAIVSHHPSVLRQIEDGFREAPLCSALNDEICAGRRAWFYAVLPVCRTAAEIGCIESVSSRTKSGKVDEGKYSQYFPTANTGTFQGDANSGVPEGSLPSVWRLDQTPHQGGLDYLVIAAISGYSPASRRTLEDDLSLRVALFPVAFLKGFFGPRSPTAIGNSVEFIGESQSNCVSADDGMCASRQEFPADTRFSVALRLLPSNVPAAWFHGRLEEPVVNFASAGSSTRIVVEAAPVEVPSVGVWKPLDALPDAVRDSYEKWHICCTLMRRPCSADSECLPLMKSGDGAITDLVNWRKVYDDQSTWTRSTWSFGSDQRLVNRPDTIACMKEKGILYGLITTNAAGYSGGPPTFSSNSKAFTYEVASPHFDTKGEENRGRYSLVLRSQTAQCLYGSTKGTISATVSVTDSATGKTSVAVSTVSNDGTWLTLNASGFTYSSQKIEVSLSAPATIPVKKSVTVSPRNALRTVTCVKGTRRIRVTGRAPSCPKGFIRQ